MKNQITVVLLLFALAVVCPMGAHAQEVHPLSGGPHAAASTGNDTPLVQGDPPYPGSWAASATSAPGNPQMSYVFMYQSGTSLWGIFYRCETTGVLPCTWTNTWEIYLPRGAITTDTAYSLTSFTPFSHYTGSVTFNSPTTATELITACTAVTESGYVAPPATGNYATETAPCATPTNPPYMAVWQKLL